MARDKADCRSHGFAQLVPQAEFDAPVGDTRYISTAVVGMGVNVLVGVRVCDGVKVKVGNGVLDGVLVHVGEGGMPVAVNVGV